MQSDLARVGIKVELAPMDMVSMYAAYNAARLPAVLGFWNPPAPENQLWASATVVRVAKRLHWDVPPDFTQAGARCRRRARPGEVRRAVAANIRQKMVDFAHQFVLIQPVYQVAVRKSVGGLKVTAAGWMAELDTAKPA